MSLNDAVRAPIARGSFLMRAGTARATGDRTAIARLTLAVLVVLSVVALALSIATGAGLSYFAKTFGDQQPVIRSMPNTPAAIGKGQLKHVLGKINGEHHGRRFSVSRFGGSVHGGLLR